MPPELPRAAGFGSRPWWDARPRAELARVRCPSTPARGRGRAWVRSWRSPIMRRWGLGRRRHSLSLDSTEQPGKYVLFGGVAYAEVTREVLVLAPDPIWEWSRRAAVHAERVMSGGTYDSGAADPATPLVFGCSN